MPVTVTDTVQDINGVITKSTPRIVSDEDIARDTAPLNIRSALAILDQWAVDADAVDTAWTGTTYSATKDQALRLTIRRFGLICKHIHDLARLSDKL